MLNAVLKVFKERATHRTLILRMERTDGLNGGSSSPADLFGEALLADSIVCLCFSSAGFLFTGGGLNMEDRFALCTRNTQFIGINRLFK